MTLCYGLRRYTHSSFHISFTVSKALQKKGDSTSRGQRETNMIPPHEIKNKDFTKAMRGYSTTEVDDYITYVIEKYTELYRENDDLERRLKTVTDELHEIKKEEESIRSALINAQKASKKIINDARAQANEIRKQAQADCQAILESFEDKFAREDKVLSQIKAGIRDFKADIFEKYRRHIEWIEEILPDQPAERDDDTSHREHARAASDAVRHQLNAEFPIDLKAETPEASSTMVFNKVQTVTLDEKSGTTSLSDSKNASEDGEEIEMGTADVMDDKDYAAFAQSQSGSARHDAEHSLTPTEEFDLVYPDDTSIYEDGDQNEK